MAIGDILRLSVQWLDDGNSNEVVNVFHFRQNSVLVFDTPEEDLISRFANDVSTLYAALVTASYTLRLYSARNLSSDPLTGMDVPDTTVGTLSGAQNIPRQMAPVVTWRTGFLGRSYRGRNYLPPITEDHQNDGLLSSGFQSDAADFAQSILDMSTPTISFGSWELVVHSETVPADTVVTAFTIQPIMATQRRRRFGVGA